jgi:hypothetical protein
MTFHRQPPLGRDRPEGVTVEDVVEYCAGLDVHRDTVVATVRYPEGGRRSSTTRTFGTDTAELVALGDWLVVQKVTPRTDGAALAHVADIRRSRDAGLRGGPGVFEERTVRLSRLAGVLLAGCHLG